MKHWKRWLKPKGGGAESENSANEKLKLYREICQAHREWEISQEKLHYVKEAEQIDYVIYLQEAAEKRYVMLLRQAKRMNLNVFELYKEIGDRPQLPAGKASGKAMEG